MFMPICLRSQPSCHAPLKFAGYSNLLTGDILKMSNLKLSQPGVIGQYTMKINLFEHNILITFKFIQIETITTAS